jgi:predicted alpha/beta hydrolase
MKKKTYPANSNIYLIINNGARVLQNKYTEFAEYVSNNNINVITYNYSDTDVPENKLKTSKTSIQEWATCDMNTIIDSIVDMNSEAKIFVLGHSLGGQIIGLTENCAKLDGIILVAAQTGYWKFWPFPLNIINYLTWYLYVPMLLKTYGFFPKGKDKNLSHMPKRATTDWMKWCQSPNYLFENISLSEQYYNTIKCPLLSISFGDDLYATKQAVDWLTSKYQNVKLNRIHYTSKEYKYGHSSAFEPSNFSTIGTDIINFIKA